MSDPLCRRPRGGSLAQAAGCRAARARHTGRTRLVGPQTPQVAWRLETGFSEVSARIETVPAIGADGTIYVPVIDRRVLAVNPDGTLQWTFEAFGSTTGISPAIGAGGTIHVGASGFDHTLYAIDPDGTTRWMFPTDCRPFPFPGGCTFAPPNPPAVGPDGTVYIANDAGCGGDPPSCVPGVFYAVRPDGRLRWRVPLGLTGIYAPSIGAFGTIYFITKSGWLVAMRPNGTVTWVHEVPSPTAPQAIGADGVIYVPTAEGLHAVGPFGIRRWFAATPHPLGDIPAIGGDGTIYVNGEFQAGSFSYLYAFGAP